MSSRIRRSKMLGKPSRSIKSRWTGEPIKFNVKRFSMVHKVLIFRELNGSLYPL